MDAGSGDVSKCAEHVRFQWKVEADQGGIQPASQPDIVEKVYRGVGILQPLAEHFQQELQVVLGQMEQGAQEGLLIPAEFLPFLLVGSQRWFPGLVVVVVGQLLTKN